MGAGATTRFAPGCWRDGSNFQVRLHAHGQRRALTQLSAVNRIAIKIIALHAGIAWAAALKRLENEGLRRLMQPGR